MQEQEFSYLCSNVIHSSSEDLGSEDLGEQDGVNFITPIKCLWISLRPPYNLQNFIPPHQTCPPITLQFTCKNDLLICLIMTKSISVNNIDIWLYKLQLRYSLLYCPEAS